MIGPAGFMASPPSDQRRPLRIRIVATYCHDWDLWLRAEQVQEFLGAEKGEFAAAFEEVLRAGALRQRGQRYRIRKSWLAALERPMGDAINPVRCPT